MRKKKGRSEAQYVFGMLQIWPGTCSYITQLRTHIIKNQQKLVLQTPPEDGNT